jgi:hypothetical protein
VRVLAVDTHLASPSFSMGAGFGSGALLVAEGFPINR